MVVKYNCKNCNYELNISRPMQSEKCPRCRSVNLVKDYYEVVEDPIKECGQCGKKKVSPEAEQFICKECKDD